MSEAITQGVRIRATAFFVPERSTPARGLYFFAYRMEITNTGDDSVRLISRHWVITDGQGEVQEVRGEGVVGSQPLLRPGESFAYTSACPLSTAVGTMEGTYHMDFEDTEGGFDAVIAPFTLAAPYALN